jgi:hypothetical protein
VRVVTRRDFQNLECEGQAYFIRGILFVTDVSPGQLDPLLTRNAGRSRSEPDDHVRQNGAAAS